MIFLVLEPPGTPFVPLLRNMYEIDDFHKLGKQLAQYLQFSVINPSPYAMSDNVPIPSLGQETVPVEHRDDNNISRFRVPGGGCCACMSHDGIEEVRGISYGGVARGAISMSNVYLANALIHLACKASGGFDETGTRCVNPNINIYGMKPYALISNIAVIASILAALTMPPTGAIIDYTRHRNQVGIWSAVGLVVISAVQVATIDVSARCGIIFG